MRVVLDSNVLFSALISPRGAPDAIYRAWRAARFEVVTSRTTRRNSPGQSLPQASGGFTACPRGRDDQ